MHSYILRRFLKEQRHLSLCQPHGFILQPHIDSSLPICGLIDDYLVVDVFHVYNNAICAILLHSKCPFQRFPLGNFCLAVLLDEKHLLLINSEPQ